MALVATTSSHISTVANTAAGRWDKAVTFAFWLRRISATGGGGSFGRVFDGPGAFLYVEEAASGLYVSFPGWAISGDFRFAMPSYSSAILAWQSHVVTYHAASTSALPRWWMDGIERTLSTFSPPTGSYTSPVPGPTYLGNRADGGRVLNGGVAHFAMWPRVLTPSEALMVSEWGPASAPGYNVYLPLQRNGPLGLFTEVTGAGYRRSMSNDPALRNVSVDFPDPLCGRAMRKAYRAFPRLPYVGVPTAPLYALAGTLYTQSVSASLTGAGALSRRTSRTLAASVTGTGALARRTARSLAASETATATVTKRTARSLGGSVTATGAVSRLVRRTLSASLTASAAVVAVFLAAATAGLGLITALLTWTARYRSTLTHTTRHQADLTATTQVNAELHHHTDD